MNVKEMAMIGLQHWNEVNPEFVKELAKKIDLQTELEASARLTLREMETLMLGGMSEAEAWQASREIFLLKDPEEKYDLDRL